MKAFSDKKKRIIMLLIVVAVCMFTGCGSLMQKKNKKKIELPVKIALIDTGISTQAIDESYVSTGYNYLNSGVYTLDTIGHGTSIASIIVGCEKADIQGICTDVVLVPLVYCGSDEEGSPMNVEVSVLAQMVRDAVDQYNCNIINISSGIKKDEEVLRSAVEYAVEKGALIVSCAGNEGTEDVYYPGGYEDVLCVGSINEELTQTADFSQSNDTVDILAPGENVMVATMKGNAIKQSGTSYSAAFVTGYAAKMWNSYPELSAAQVQKKLLKGAKHLKGSRVGYLGG